MAETPKQHADYAVDFVKSDYDKSVISRRLLIADKLAEKKVFATAAAIDAYKPSAEETAAWERERDIFVDRTLSVLTRPGKRLEGANIPQKADTAPLRKV